MSQGILGEECAWCGLPATGHVLVRKAQKKGGEPGMASAVIELDVNVPACDDHIAKVLTGDSVGPKPRRKLHVEQLDIFGEL